MRLAAVALISLGLISFTGLAAGQPPNQEPRLRHVSVAVTTAAVRATEHTRTDLLLLWNRNERTTPIGHGVMGCVRAASGGVLGGGLLSCNLTLALPLGKLVASGIVHNMRRFTLVITGGTGVYKEASGPLFVRSVSGNGVRRLTFTL